MAVIKDPAGIKRSGVSPDMGVVSYVPGQQGKAVESLGTAVGSLGRVARMQMHFQDTIDTQQAKEALIAFKGQEMEMGNAVRKLQNGDAYGGTVRQDTMTGYDTAATTTGSKLSEGARVKYDLKVKESRNVFEAGVVSHMMKQEENHKDALYINDIEMTSNAWANDPTNPLIEQVSKDTILENIAEKVAREGLTGEEGAQMAQEIFGTTHSLIVDKFLSQGMTNDATTHLARAIKNKEVTPKQALAIQNKIRPESDYQEGRVLAATANTMREAGASETDVKNYLADNATNVKAAEAANTLDNRNQAARIAEQTKLGHQILGDYRDGTSKGLLDPRLPGMKITNPGLYEGIVQSINAMETSKAKATDPQSTVGQVATAARITSEGLTNEKILENYDQLGPREAKRLIKEVADRDQAKDDKSKTLAYTFRLDTDIVNGALPPNLTDEQNIALKYTLELETAKWIQQKGHAPSREEQQQIASTLRRAYKTGESYNNIFTGGRYITRDDREYWMTQELGEVDEQGNPKSKEFDYRFPVSFGAMFPVTIQQRNPVMIGDAWNDIEELQRQNPGADYNESQWLKIWKAKKNKEAAEEIAKLKATKKK